MSIDACVLYFTMRNIANATEIEMARYLNYNDMISELPRIRAIPNVIEILGWKQEILDLKPTPSADNVHQLTNSPGFMKF